MQTTFDFQDGKGPVPARRHVNQDGELGGWVAETAYVDKTCYIHPKTYIYDYATLRGNIKTSGPIRIYNNAILDGNITITGTSYIFENALIRGRVILIGNNSIFGYVYLQGSVCVYNSKISSNNQIAWGNFFGKQWTLTKELLAFDGTVQTIKWWEVQIDKLLTKYYENNTITFFIKNLLILSKTLE